MARAVERNPCIIAARPSLRVERVDNEVAELPRPPAQRHDCGQVGFLLELEQRTVKHHRCAGTGRDDDRHVAREGPHRVPHHLARGGPVAPVKRWLTAAGLIRREFDRAAKKLEYLDGRARHIGIKTIAETRCHELDTLRDRGEAARGVHLRAKKPGIL